MYEGTHDLTVRTTSLVRSLGIGGGLALGLLVGLLTQRIEVGVTIALIGSGMSGFGGVERQSSRLTIRERTIVRHFQPAQTLLAPQEDVSLPQIVEYDEHTYLRLQKRWRAIDIKVRDREEANLLTDALALRRVTFYLWNVPTPGWTVPGAALIALGVFIVFAAFSWPIAISWLLAIPLLLGAYGLARRMLGARVGLVVGADGIQLRPGRFIPYSAVKSVRSEGRQIVIALEHEELRFATALGEEAEVDADAIVKHVESLRKDAKLAPAAPPETPGLMRGDRTVREWLEGLRKLGEGGETAFRDASVPRDQLWQIVESHDAAPLEKLAAAIALRTSGLSADEKPRLRIAADETARPELATRIRIATDGDDEALAQALEAAQKEA